MFAVNNNGMIIFHPRLKTVVSTTHIELHCVCALPSAVIGSGNLRHKTNCIYFEISLAPCDFDLRSDWLV